MQFKSIPEEQQNFYYTVIRTIDSLAVAYEQAKQERKSKAKKSVPRKKIQRKNFKK